MAATIGDGVFATAPLPAGTIVWTQDPLDRIIAPGELERLPALLRGLVERYAYIDDRGDHILCWDAGRLVNHSCAANLRGIGARVLVAARDIGPGEEITCDYAECNLETPLACACGAPGCRGEIARADLERLADAWDAEVARLLPLVRRAEQPLWPAQVDPEETAAMLDGRRPVPSFRVLYPGAAAVR